MNSRNKNRRFILYALVLINVLVAGVWLISSILSPTSSLSFEAAIVLLGAFIASFSLLSSFNDAFDVLGKLTERKEIDTVDKELGDKIEHVQNITIIQESARQLVMLEYRIAVLEGTLDWLLENGVVVKSLSQEETSDIYSNAIEKIRDKYPDVQIAVDKEMSK